MTIAYLALGSNLNTPHRQLYLAIKSLARLPHTFLLRQASLLSNQAYGRKQQPRFINTVVKINTSLTAWQLLRQCQHIEKKFGRTRRVRWGARTLDIDILIFDSIKSTHPKLLLPHPELSKRDFVLLPLSEIAPQLIISNGLSVQQLAEHFLTKD